MKNSVITVIVDKGVMQDSHDDVDLSKEIIDWGYHNKNDGVFIVKDFDKTNPESIIGDAKCYIQKGIMYANINIYDKQTIEDVENLYPAIGGTITESDGRTINKFELTEVALCESTNVDKSIGTIKEQLLKPTK